MQLPHVSSESGPILLGDFDVLRKWRGDAYDSACQLLERSNPSQFPFGDGKSVVWDFGGPGTGDVVVVGESHISVVRIWPGANWTDEHTKLVTVASATARFSPAVLAHLTIASGYLLALWAPEDASKFLSPHGPCGVPGPRLSIGDGGTYVRVPCGTYEVTACEWQSDGFDITKLDLRRINHLAKPITEAIRR
jgi:hypothetical protein